MSRRIYGSEKQHKRKYFRRLMMVRRTITELDDCGSISDIDFGLFLFSSFWVLLYAAAVCIAFASHYRGTCF